MGGCDPDEPRTRGTSCAIPSWNVPKLIFGEGEKEKVSPKVSLDQAIDEKVSPKVSLDQAIDEKVSPNKEAVFFLSLFFFMEMEYA